MKLTSKKKKKKQRNKESRKEGTPKWKEAFWTGRNFSHDNSRRTLVWKFARIRLPIPTNVQKSSGSEYHQMWTLCNLREIQMHFWLLTRHLPANMKNRLLLLWIYGLPTRFDGVFGHFFAALAKERFSTDTKKNSLCKTFVNFFDDFSTWNASIGDVNHFLVSVIGVGHLFQCKATSETHQKWIHKGRKNILCKNLVFSHSDQNSPQKQLPI